MNEAASSSNRSQAAPFTSNGNHGFTPDQKAYIEGLMAGIAQRRLNPFGTPEADDGPNQAKVEPSIYGTPLSEATKQEAWKHEKHGLDAWPDLREHARKNAFPNDADTFRFRYHGLFHVAPAQDSFMLRCRIPAGELAAHQLRGLASIAERFGDGKAAITTRSNIQIRQIQPKHLVDTLTELQRLGLTSRGSGVDNVRNITASPTAGVDPQELVDTRPFAHELHHYILNQRDLYNLPRKFNVAFEGGGAIDTVADTNDIGFMAVRLPNEMAVKSLDGGHQETLSPGVYFRVELAGITGHQQFAKDAGIVVPLDQAVPLAVAILRVFIENGDRTDRNRARLKYLIDAWGIEPFLKKVQEKAPFPLLALDLKSCAPRSPAVPHGHVGVYKQKEKGMNYLGVSVPVGVMTCKQMRRVAELAENYGTGEIRLTPWQSLIVVNVPDAFVETCKRALSWIGLSVKANSIKAGLVACTGNTGCKWASTDTKGHALRIGEALSKKIKLDQPINIHFTGCPHSCAQHYIGDIGLLGVKVKLEGESVEGYHVLVGGAAGMNQAMARQVFSSVTASSLEATLESMLAKYLNHREAGESFSDFTRRHDIKQLQELFS